MHFALSDKRSCHPWAAFPPADSESPLDVGWARSEVCELGLCPLSGLEQLPQTAQEGMVQTVPAPSPGRLLL